MSPPRCDVSDVVIAAVMTEAAFYQQRQMPFRFNFKTFPVSLGCDIFNNFVRITK